MYTVAAWLALSAVAGFGSKQLGAGASLPDWQQNRFDDDATSQHRQGQEGILILPTWQPF